MSRDEERELSPPYPGAFWYLETCGTAVRVQQDRLLGVAGPTDRTVDLWLALVALRNALRAVDLAIRVAPGPEPLRRIQEGFEESQAAHEIRNVFEHFDEYFFGEGRLQRGQEKPHLLSPRISMSSGPGFKTVKVLSLALHRVSRAFFEAAADMPDVSSAAPYRAGARPPANPPQGLA